MGTGELNESKHINCGIFIFFPPAHRNVVVAAETEMNSGPDAQSRPMKAPNARSHIFVH